MLETLDYLKSCSVDKFILAHLNAAESYAALSHSNRSKVGAVLVKKQRVISVGYNGTPTGWDNCCEDAVGKTKTEVIHAESNALMFAAKYGVSTDGCSLVTTMSPCIECAKLIYQAGIVEVYYRDKYRDDAGLDFLTKCGVKLCQI